MGLFDDLTGQAISILTFDVSDDTFVQQTNRKLCLAFLITLSVLVCGRQYVGEPITCFCPAQFEKFHVAYTNSFCWINNNYAVPFNEILPVSDESREDHEISYYQWVPLILVFLAAMFYMPRLFWKGMCGHTGINIKKILLMSNDAAYMTPKRRDEHIEVVTLYIDKWIDIRDGKPSANRRFKRIKETLHVRGINSGNYLSFIYIITCLFYFLNTVLQIFLINAFLGNDFMSLGPDFVRGITANRKWEDLRRFPRVAFCDMNIRQLQNVQRWTIQCSLPVNLFNEKVFILLWFLLITMSVVNGVYFVYNIIMTFLPKRKNMYIRKFLDYTRFPAEIRNSAKLLDVEKSFVESYLKHDGVFILWLVSHNTSQVIGSQLVERLWINYCKKPYVQKFMAICDIEA
ncbi:innexin unc-9-like [Mizuhopecten yessoensis]|uniref:Innexin n=1 Tax=Mizuhopecten yessoensis TaxID=6573 RepID=A0A210Q0T3_MIZYE|nr:innexin unc-9-like [Mizuhopecten yessoensis]OWF42364.1 Innexin unc-9 [Mizuhopecten yessoensis]